MRPSTSFSSPVLLPHLVYPSESNSGRPWTPHNSGTCTGPSRLGPGRMVIAPLLTTPIPVVVSAPYDMMTLLSGWLLPTLRSPRASPRFSSMLSPNGSIATVLLLAPNRRPVGSEKKEFFQCPTPANQCFFGVGVDVVLPLPPPFSPAATPIRILGLWVDTPLNFTGQANQVAQTVDEILCHFNQQQHFMAPSIRCFILESTAQSIVKYCLAAYWPCLGTAARATLQHPWARICHTSTGCPPSTNMYAAVQTAGCSLLPVVAAHAIPCCQQRTLLLTPAGSWEILLSHLPYH